MPCDRREHTGTCSHVQCPYPDRSPDGYDCVEIVEQDLINYSKREGNPIPDHCLGKCECGDNCVPECEYSYFEPEGAKWHFDMRSQTWLCGESSMGIGIFKDEETSLFNYNICINGDVHMVETGCCDLEEIKKEAAETFHKRYKLLNDFSEGMRQLFTEE